MNSVRKFRNCGLWVAPILGLLLQALPGLSDPLSVTLRYTEVPYPADYRGIVAEERTQPFARETGLTGANLKRGILRMGAETNYLPFAWDQSEGKLYLDLNRNRDLSDDPEGRFSTDRRGSYQTFEDVHVPFQTDHGPQRLLLNLSMYHYRSDTHASAAVRSFWIGQVSLQNRDWQVGLIESPDAPGKVASASLLLRPWADRDQSFSVHDGVSSAFPLPEILFLDGQSYALQCIYSQADSHPELRLEFTPQTNDMGELEIAGKHISRLLLTGKDSGRGLAALIHDPAPKVQLPAGEYADCRVLLQTGDIRAHRDSSTLPRFNREPLFTIKADKPSRLAAGGPLTNTVNIQRRGSTLVFNYRLIGAEGQTYQLAGPRANPRFTVYREGSQIATGKFEFG